MIANKDLYYILPVIVKKNVNLYKNVCYRLVRLYISHKNLECFKYNNVFFQVLNEKKLFTLNLIEISKIKLFYLVETSRTISSIFHIKTFLLNYMTDLNCSLCFHKTYLLTNCGHLLTCKIVLFLNFWL